MQWSAIVLAGGRSSRMGRDKALLRAGGRSLVSWCVDACGEADEVVVVAPATLRVDAGRRIVRTLEDPPDGGPVAGIAAGVEALTSAAPFVCVLACDLPGAAAIVPALVRAAATGDTADGVVFLDDTGYPQYLAGMYRVASLTAAIAGYDSVRDLSVRRFMGPLALLHLPSPGLPLDDVDTPADAITHGLE